MSRANLITSCLTVAVLAALPAGCKKAEAPAAPPPPAVEVAEAGQKDVPVFEEWIGSLDGMVNAEIRPQIEGYVLKQVYREGFAVRAGETLYEIDPRQFQATNDQARGTLAQYEATLANAKQQVARYRPLAAAQAISQQELDDAETRERTAQANVESARASLEKAKLDLGWTKIVSPIDGIAGVSKSQVGELVNRLTVMTTVSQVNPIKVNFNASEQEYLTWVAKHGAPEKTLRASQKLEDGPLELILANDSVYPHRGRPVLLGREVDVKTGTIQLAGAFPNPGNVLRPGQYAKVRVAMGVNKAAVVVPQRAVAELQGTYQVALVGADNKVTMKVVKPGPVEGSLRVIEEGVKPGDKVVVEGLQRVRTGVTVNPTTAGARAAAAEGEAAKPAGKEKEGGK